MLNVLSVIDCSTNGPTWRAVSQTASPAATVTASVAPCWPNRSAPHISAGNTMYVSGWLLDSAMALSATTAPIISAPSHLPLPLHAGDGACTHAKTNGMMTSEPEASLRNQLRQKVQVSDDPIAPPARTDTRAKVEVIAAPAAMATNIPPICSS